jgi:excisionase family DNA binding protein
MPVAAARDAAARARSLADGLESLIRALDALVAEVPQKGVPTDSLRHAVPREGELWTAAEVALYLKTSKSWVYQHAASGRLPYTKVGALLRFEPNAVKDWARSGSAAVRPSR